MCLAFVGIRAKLGPERLSTHDVLPSVSPIARSAERKKLTHLVTVPTVLNAGPYTEAGRASKGENLCEL